MSKKYRNKLIMFLVLALIALAIWPFEAFFAKGLLVGLLIAAVVYILREFLPKRR